MMSPSEDTLDIGAAQPGSSVPAIILAGGRARRMGGGDKTLLTLSGRPILEHILAGLWRQCGPIALNANGDPARFAAWALPVLADPWPDQPGPDQPGPLAGILAGMIWAAPLASRVISWPGDTPFPPADLAARLAGALATTQAGVACAASRGRVHPVIGLWNVACAPLLREALGRGRGRVLDVAEAAGLATVAWDAGEGSPDPFLSDPFFNVNTPADLDRARALPLRAGSAPADWGNRCSPGK